MDSHDSCYRITCNHFKLLSDMELTGHICENANVFIVRQTAHRFPGYLDFFLPAPQYEVWVIWNCDRRFDSRKLYTGALAPVLLLK